MTPPPAAFEVVVRSDGVGEIPDLLDPIDLACALVVRGHKPGDPRRARGHWLDGEVKHAVHAAQATMEVAAQRGEDGLPSAPFAEYRAAVARLPLVWAQLRRALDRLALRLVRLARWIEARRTRTPPPARLTPDRLPVPDLGRTVSALRVLSTPPTGPPRPFAIAGTTG